MNLGLKVSDFEFQGLGVLGLEVGGLDVWRFGGWVSRFVVCGFGVSGFVFRVRGTGFGVKCTLNLVFKILGFGFRD